MISAERWWTRFWGERSSSFAFSRLTGEVKLLEAGGRGKEKKAVLRHVQVVEHQPVGPDSLNHIHTLDHHCTVRGDEVEAAAT